MNITLTPVLRRFVDNRVKSGRYVDGSDVVRTALRQMEAQETTATLQAQFQSLGGIGDNDIMALAFMVMMEAAKSAQENLKAIMAQVKAINKAKAAFRDVMDKVQRDVAANTGCLKDGQQLDFSRGMGSERAYHRVRVPIMDPDTPEGVRYERTDLYSGRITRAEALRAILDGLKSKLDNLSEMGEMESLRLQMAMDRLSKMMSVLSNLLKKISDTSAAITQNLK